MTMTPHLVALEDERGEVGEVRHLGRQAGQARVAHLPRQITNIFAKIKEIQMVERPD